MVRSQFRDLAPQRKVTFEAELVDGQAALFEAQPSRRANREAENKVKNATSSTFSPPFSPVFVGKQNEASEE